jgi:hypothetical protein
LPNRPPGGNAIGIRSERGKRIGRRTWRSGHVHVDLADGDWRRHLRSGPPMSARCRPRPRAEFALALSSCPIQRCPIQRCPIQRSPIQCGPIQCGTVQYYVIGWSVIRCSLTQARAAQHRIGMRGRGPRDACVARG